jgi:hypothetical protein
MWTTNGLKKGGELSFETCCVWNIFRCELSPVATILRPSCDPLPVQTVAWMPARGGNRLRCSGLEWQRWAGDREVAVACRFRLDCVSQISLWSSVRARFYFYISASHSYLFAVLTFFLPLPGRHRLCWQLQFVDVLCMYHCRACYFYPSLIFTTVCSYCMCKLLWKTGLGSDPVLKHVGTQLQSAWYFH